MKPSKRYEWLCVYSLIWTAMVLLSLWTWGEAIIDPLVTLIGCVVMAVGYLLIAAFIWWRYQPDGKKKEKKLPPNPKASAPKAPAGGAKAAA